MSRQSDVHVSKHGASSWKVTQNGERLSTHRTQANAIDRGRSEARSDGVDLLTHGRDGRIRSKDSFGKDPAEIYDREH